jgi:hypothetical protein
VSRSEITVPALSAFPRFGSRGVGEGFTARASVARARATLLAAVFAVSCSTSHFDGRLFRRGDVAFRLESVPSSWRSIEINDTALAFRDDENAATVAINGRCGRDAEDVPLRSLTQHLFLQFTEQRLEQQELVPLDGREALRTEMTAKLDGVEKHFHVVVLKKDGCVYDFLQIADQRADPDVFLGFVKGFSTVS